MPSAEIYIEATETDPVALAQDSIRALSRRLTVADLAAVRDYLAAADRALYAPAAGAAETRLLVRALRVGAADLSQRIADLVQAPDASTAVGLEALLAVHLDIEQTVLLPALATLPGADLPALAGDLKTLLAGGQLDEPAVIDVRPIPHGQRHPRIFARFARLAAGEAFTLVNNHDPKPLRREFEAAYPGAFSWDYVESGPEQWQVRIGRVTAPA